MESRIGTKTEAIIELRKISGLIDDVLGNQGRQLRLADEEENEAKALETRKRISKDQDEFMECMKHIRGKIHELEEGS